MHAHIHAHTYTCTYTCTHTYIYIYIHIGVKTMIVQEDDEPWEIELKLARLDTYNDSLCKRQKRKQFVLDHGLMEIKKSK